jgi:hypothetical protein
MYMCKSRPPPHRKGLARCDTQDLPVRTALLANLDEALALHRSETGDSIDSPEAEREVFRDLDIDPDGVEQAREDTDELPEFMQ